MVKYPFEACESSESEARWGDSAELQLPKSAMRILTTVDARAGLQKAFPLHFQI